MKKVQIIIILVSVVAGLTVIATAYIASNDTTTENNDNQEVIFSNTDLAQNDGTDGKSCFVAIDNVVYEIRQGNKWKDGEHIPSEGLAYCGKDLSGVIDDSPHGSSILSILTEIGRLEQ
jgi:predicted heme/steroid binding protein